ncbi:asparaginyl-tRNA synthetase [Meredithblackwellia eburnea MCA 4105]
MRIFAGLRSQSRSIASVLQHPASNTTQEITLNGWVRSARIQKNVSFAVLNDGSNVNGIQAVIPKHIQTQENKLSVGAAISVTGNLVKSPAKGQDLEFSVTKLELLGDSHAESYPIPNTKQGVPLPILRKNAHLRPRAPGPAAMLRLRSEMAFSAAQHFRKEGYVNVQTPLITSSDCEGAGEVFRVEAGPSSPAPPAPAPNTPASTTTQTLATATALPPPPTPRYLTVSSQLHLEALASSLSKVWTLSPSFRAENSDTARHLQEFWMLEAELSFLPASPAEGLEQVMRVAEDLVRALATTTHNDPSSAYFYSQTPGLEDQIASITSSSSPFPRISYTEAIEILSAHHSSSPTTFAFAPVWGASIQTEHEKWLADAHFHSPVFVTDYPAHLKPWYMLRSEPEPTATNGGRETVACFDLLVPRLGELIGGSLREHRSSELLKAMSHHGVDEKQYEWYMDLRKYGSTRHGGFGMGWERLVAFLTGLENVRECIAFPRAAEGSRF